MRISDGRLQAFIDAYEHDFGERLHAEEAREMAQRLLDLYVLLARPTPSELADREATKAEAAAFVFDPDAPQVPYGQVPESPEAPDHV